MSNEQPVDINEIPTEVIETDLLIIGGGNAGCFSAIEAKKLNPELKVTIMEKAHISRSGACAAVVAGKQRGLLNSKVKVDLPGGRLIIDWGGDGQSVLMTGPAETVYKGSIEL